MSKDGININSAPNNFTRPLKPPGTPKSLKARSNWIEPNDLPKGFWKECFIGWAQHGQTEVIDGVKMVRKVELYPQWYLETEREWTSFQGFAEYRVMVVEYPKITEGDFK